MGLRSRSRDTVSRPACCETSPSFLRYSPQRRTRSTRKRCGTFYTPLLTVMARLRGSGSPTHLMTAVIKPENKKELDSPEKGQINQRAFLYENKRTKQIRHNVYRDWVTNITNKVLSSRSAGRPFSHNGHRPKVGAAVPLWGRGLGPHLTLCRLLRDLSPLPSGILIHPAVWPQQTWTENWGGCAPFGEGSWVPI